MHQSLQLLLILSRISLSLDGVADSLSTRDADAAAVTARDDVPGSVGDDAELRRAAGQAVGDFVDRPVAPDGDDGGVPLEDGFPREAGRVPGTDGFYDLVGNPPPRQGDADPVDLPDHLRTGDGVVDDPEHRDRL